jgi:asparagine synthase (glutamine-hydrolysing)
MKKAATHRDTLCHIDPETTGGMLWFCDLEQTQGESLKEKLPAWIEKWVWVDEATWKASPSRDGGKSKNWFQLDPRGDFGRQWFDRINTDSSTPAKAISSGSVRKLSSEDCGLHVSTLAGITAQGFAVIAGKSTGGLLPLRTILAVDRLGSRRLFYRCTDSWIAWSTDLMQMVDLRRSLGEDRIVPDFSHIAYYLKYLHFPAWNALPMAGVGCLPPASFLCNEGNQPQIRSYWKPSFEPVLAEFNHARDLVRRKLAVAVKQDAGEGSGPVGLLLSGGLDSTLLLSLLRDGGRTVWTYAVGFDGKADECSDAEFAAGHFQSRHQTLTLRPQDVEPLLWKVTRCTGCPSGNPSSLALYQAAETARGDVERLFSGIGSDEIFCGHRKHVLARYWPAARPLLNLMRSGCRLRPEYRRFGAGPVKHYNDLYAFFAEDQMQSLLKERQTAPDSYHFQGIVNGSREQTVFQTDLFLWLAGGVLPQSTAVAADCGISLKTPFCSAAMVELAARIPLHLKVRGNTGKWILRQAFSEVLPARVLKKRRRGFTLPLDKWLRGPLAPLLDRYLNPDLLSSRALLEPETVFQMIQIHRSGRLDLSLPLWALISLEVWQRIFIDGQTHPLESER